MTIAGLPDWFGKPLAVLLIDLLLAGDNALVIALVCRGLPPGSRRAVLASGAAGAVVLRVLLAGSAGSILGVPALKLAGGVLLALLALNLTQPEPPRAAASPALDARAGLGAAVLLVILADVLMSLDNVLALAAVAGDSLLYLGIGLLLSVSIVMFGSALVGSLMARFPELARLGAALLGWVAGQMAVSDALVQDWVATQAPALPLIVPALTAAYVYLSGRDMPAPAALPPRPVPAAVTIAPAPRPEPEPAPALAAEEEADSDGTDRTVLFVFLALFVVAGLFLAAIEIIGGGLI